MILTFFTKKLLWITLAGFYTYLFDKCLTIHHVSNTTAAIPTNLPTVNGSLPALVNGIKNSGKAKNSPARIIEAPNKILISIFFDLNYNMYIVTYYEILKKSRYGPRQNRTAISSLQMRCSTTKL